MIPTRLGQILYVCILASFICACANSSDTVRDRAMAIQLGKESCGVATDQFLASEKWHAMYHHGSWHVWLSLEYGDWDEPGMGAMDIWIHASDGSIDKECATVVS